MYARKPTRVSDGCNDRRDSQSYQTHKSQPKSQSSSLHRYDKVRDGSSDPTPPYKMLRRSDESPVSRHGDSTGHGKPKTSHTVRGKNGTSGSPQENSHNNSSHHGSDSHATQSKPADRSRLPATRLPLRSGFISSSLLDLLSPQHSSQSPVSLTSDTIITTAVRLQTPRGAARHKQRRNPLWACILAVSPPDKG
ncbi:WW domain-containing adapter protein with coiled-coil-like isoform X1 [Lates japonicus]|uniref:WW domain-containing adapter protein with coiled-coil-like isoform X1 n=1 Tax=Lates japonicus TaxID=270547 RepID=A0AAD3MCA7_LATJO|nr:WW domain-containing adapter protein with coiled-coil-like isoform X1 [Lates japonicus]